MILVFSFPKSNMAPLYSQSCMAVSGLQVRYAGVRLVCV